MSERWFPVAVSLGGVLAAYLLYAVTVVPWVEPEAPPITPGAVVPAGERPPSGHAPNLTLQRIFADEPDAWELKNPKLLRNEQGILLLDKYKNLGDGKVKIQPCTFVLLPARDAQDPQRERQAIILRAPEGAILQFDRDLDIRSGEVGRLLGGVLLGRVTIRSDSKQPGPEDDLYISTFDVKLAGQTITTPHPVDVRWGRNVGRGTDLRIDLAPAENRADALANIGGVERLTLARDVALRLVLDDDAPQAEAPAAPPADAHSGQPGEAPAAATGRGTAEQRGSDPFPLDRRGALDVTCQGRFEYDFVQQTATFYDQVDVVRQLPGAPRDHLACQRLTTHFAPADPQAGDASPRSRQFARLRLVQLEALGKPAILHAPNAQGYARADRMEYVIDSRRITLESEREVQFRYQNNEIRAQQLHYEPGADGRIGRFLASGPGWLTWALQDEALGPPRRMEANWARQLFCRPHEGLQVVSVEGQASIQISGQGALRAEDIHAWFHEVVADPPPEGQTRARADLVPDRMLATAATGGSVEIDSPQLTGRTQRLEVWYQAEPGAGSLSPVARGSPDAGTSTVSGAAPATVVRPPGAAAVPPAATADAVRPLPPVAAPLRPVPREDPPNRFDVSGQNVQVQFVRQGEQPPRVAEVLVRGRARLVETRTAEPAQRPLQVWGDVLHLRDAHTDAAKVTVSGTGGTSPQPAHVEGRGLELEGAVIRMDQGANRAWIDGPGVMTLLVDRDLQGAPLSTPQPLRVQWQGRMLFDGTQTTFERSVVASRDKDLCRTETLEVVFAQRVDLSRSSGAARPEVARIYCRDGVYLESQTYNAQGLESIQQMQAGDLSLNLISGAVLAQGPGWLKRVGLRRSEAQFALNAGPLPGGTAAAPRTSAAAPGTDASRPAASGPAPGGAPGAGPSSAPELAYLHVQFQRDLTGNVHRRELTFNDQVKTVYGPIADWQQTLDAQRPDQLGSGAVVINCQQLTVSQLPAGDGRYWTELQARSNVMVEGQGFTASASVISYSQEKDLLVLEGTDRSSAELWLQKRPGAPRSYSAARKIRYWRSTNRIVVDDGRFLDLNQLPGTAPSGSQRPASPTPR